MFLVFCLSPAKLIKMHCMYPWCLTKKKQNKNAWAFQHVRAKEASKNSALQRHQWWKTPLDTFSDGCFFLQDWLLLLRCFIPLSVTAYYRERGLLGSIPTELGKRQGTFRTSRHGVSKSWRTETKKKKKHPYSPRWDGISQWANLSLSQTVKDCP